jgi:putative membrane protein
MSNHTVLREGEFDPKVKAYWLLSPTVAFALSVVLIPIIPIYLIIANLVLDRWIAALRCTLTDRALLIRKGLLNRVESTVPLEKITDLQMYQGPVMRFLGLHGFRVETAGSSSGPGGFLVNMIGIVDTPAFRQAVLDQRDRLSGSTATPAAPTPRGEDDLASVAREIRDSLHRIERSLAERSG